MLKRLNFSIMKHQINIITIIEIYPVISNIPISSKDFVLYFD